MPCAADREPRVAVQPQRALVPRVEVGGDSTTVWLDTPGRKAVLTGEDEVRVRVQGGVGQGAGQGFGLGLGKGHGRAGTVLVCDRLLRPLLMETVLPGLCWGSEDGCFLKLTDMS